MQPGRSNAGNRILPSWHMDPFAVEFLRQCHSPSHTHTHTHTHSHSHAHTHTHTRFTRLQGKGHTHIHTNTYAHTALRGKYQPVTGYSPDTNTRIRTHARTYTHTHKNTNTHCSQGQVPACYGLLSGPVWDGQKVPNAGVWLYLYVGECVSMYVCVVCVYLYVCVCVCECLYVCVSVCT